MIAKNVINITTFSNKLGYVKFNFTKRCVKISGGFVWEIMKKRANSAGPDLLLQRQPDDVNIFVYPCSVPQYLGSLV